MTQRELHGPYPLTDASINSHATGIGPGAYALGSDNSFSAMIVLRVGRSDVDLNSRLHDYVGQYSIFEYGFYDTATLAYHKECELYHQESPPDNIIHPDRPSGSLLRCRICGL